MGITKSEGAELFPDVRAWLERTGTTQRQLAKFLDIHEVTLCQYLGGVRDFPIDTAVSLATITDVPVEKLLTDEGAVRLLKHLSKQPKSTGSKPKKNGNVA